MIVVPCVEIVVIVFPATFDSAVVTIGDVLIAVHRPAREWAFVIRGEARPRRERRRSSSW